MSVAFRAGGAPSAGTASAAPAIPLGDPGELLIGIATTKYNPASTPAGWNLVTNVQGGSGASGADSGLVWASQFWRIADGTEPANLTITNPSGNSIAGKVLRFSKTTLLDWVLEVVTATFNTPSVNWNVTFGGSLLWVPGDLYMVHNAHNLQKDSGGVNNVTFSNELLTVPGVTVDTTELAENTIAAGDNLGWVVTQHNVLQGNKRAIPSFTMLASAIGTNGPAGCAIALRMGEQPKLERAPGVALQAAIRGLGGRRGR